jgi:hypothetical protein
MRVSKRKHWNWLASAVLALAAGLFVGARTQASHFSGRYPSNPSNGTGFHAIAQAGQVTHYIDPNFDINHRNTIRTAQTRWDETRARNTTINYANETGVRQDWQQIQQWLTSEPNGRAEYDFWGPSGGSCVRNPGAEMCKAEIRTNYGVPPHIGTSVHELGHALFAFHDHTVYDASTIMSPYHWDTDTGS